MKALISLTFVLVSFSSVFGQTKLKKIPNYDVVLSESEAKDVLCLIFGDAVSLPSKLSDLDRKFSQEILLELIDKSISMGIIEALAKDALSLTPSMKKITIAILGESIKHLYWYNNKSKEEILNSISNVKLYRTVANQIALNWKSAWEVRVQSGTPIY